MGSRAFPVPIYVKTSNYGAFTSMKQLTVTSPGSTDSTATNTTYAVVAKATYLEPEAANDNTADVFPDTAGEGANPGWVRDLLGLGLVTSASEGIDVDAGTWTVVVPISRSSGLIDSNVTGVTLGVEILRMVDASAVIQQVIGSSSQTGITITTTETDYTFNISGAAAVFPANNRLVLRVFWSWGIQVSLTGTARCHTNSASALRITAAPAYKRSYVRSVTDAPGAATDTLVRQTTSQRALADSAPASDSLTRVANFPRQLADAPDSVADSLNRLTAFNRALVDSITVSDEFARYVQVNRYLADSSSVSDDLNRTLSLFRYLDDSAPPVDDALIRQYIANRNLADSAEGLADALKREISTYRSLADLAPVEDALGRQVTYRRYLEEQLSQGGGAPIIKKRLMVVDD